MNRITALASRELRSVPGVRDVGGHVGRAVTGDQIVGANSGELWVSIDPGADYDATVAAVKRVVDGYPGLSRGRPDLLAGPGAGGARRERARTSSFASTARI